MGIHYVFFIHLPSDGHSGCVPVSAAMNKGMLVALRDSDVISFRYPPRSATAEGYGSSVSNVLRTLHTVFHGGSTRLHSHRQRTRVPVSPRPRRHLVSLVFWKSSLSHVDLGVSSDQKAECLGFSTFCSFCCKERKQSMVNHTWLWKLLLPTDSYVPLH